MYNISYLHIFIYFSNIMILYISYDYYKQNHKSINQYKNIVKQFKNIF
jgi:hypothetical protein